MTRRSGTETRQRSGVVGFRATAEERAEIEKAAEREGLRTGSYIRAKVLASPKTRAVKRPPAHAEQLARLLGQLGKIGGNLNQIAARLNRNEIATRTEISEALEEFKQLRAEIFKALGKAPK